MWKSAYVGVYQLLKCFYLYRKMNVIFRVIRFSSEERYNSEKKHFQAKEVV